MATGDQSDIFGRLKSLIPRWFGDGATVRDAVLQGLAWASSFIYSLITYTRLQTRIKTATDGWLDMIAADFFGASLVRAANQSDASFRARIIITLFRERATRWAIISVLKDLTGRTPLVFEPTRPADTGGYGVAGAGYSVAGGYGSILIPYQAFVTAFRPVGIGIPNVAGYGGSAGGPGPGGYGVASQVEYASMSMIIGAVTDADIYAAIDSVKPAGTAVWARISS
jgi:hypothetical protein